MILNNGKWTLSPAYDLLNVAIANPEDKEELALTLEGKKRKLTSAHFRNLGSTLGLNAKQINKVFERVEKFKPEAQTWIAKSFLSEEYKEKYNTLIEQRYKILINQ